jgi:uncharacterized NAD(P)/FAD-binding protein YdhS
MGEYLQWFYRALVDAAPSSLEIVHHRTPAIDLVARPDGGEELWLADGRVVVVDHVIVTSGHTANEEAGESGSHPRQISPSPVTAFLERLPANARVAVAGMGLVARDVVIALTLGRGGRFVERGGKLRYLASGREPSVHVFSRSGLPFTAKSVTGIDRTDVYKPVICTPRALDDLSGRSNGGRRLVDVRTELLPLLFGEMYARYYAQVAFQSGSIVDARAVREQLRGAWIDGRFEEERDIRSRIHRLVAGPPALRSRQLLALMDARVLKAPFGPAPSLGPAAGHEDPRLARTVMSSTAFERQPYLDTVDVVIRGHLDEPRIDGSASRLLARLYRRGRVSQFRYGAVTVGSVDLTADAHPIDLDGHVQTRIWMFGVLTEGIRHFTQYIPSPRSRIRAFEEIGGCVAEIVG